MDFWISDWISGFQIGFLDFTVDFWISVWISGFQFGFLPTVYEISFVTDPSVHLHHQLGIITAPACIVHVCTSLWLAFLASIQQGRALEQGFIVLNSMSTPLLEIYWKPPQYG